MATAIHAAHSVQHPALLPLYAVFRDRGSWAAGGGGLQQQQPQHTIVLVYAGGQNQVRVSIWSAAVWWARGGVDCIGLLQLLPCVAGSWPGMGIIGGSWHCYAGTAHQCGVRVHVDSMHLGPDTL